MDWRDEGLLLTSRRHGESSAIVELFTARHGRHLGVVRGGASRRVAPLLQPGARFSAEWSARLEGHMGTFRLDPAGTHIATHMESRAGLAALASVTALLSSALPERAAHPDLYLRTADLLAAIGAAPDWQARYVAWELALLAELGFGLALGSCALTGATQDLGMVSPRTGRAVARGAGAQWADRLLPLPRFLAAGLTDAQGPDIADGLRLTGHFLEAWLAPTLPRGLPAARARAADLLAQGAGRNSR